MGISSAKVIKNQKAMDTLILTNPSKLFRNENSIKNRESAIANGQSKTRQLAQIEEIRGRQAQSKVLIRICFSRDCRHICSFTSDGTKRKDVKGSFILIR